MKKLLIGFTILLILAFSFFIVKKFQKKNLPPPTLTKNFVDLEKIEKISKFRSCQGHTVVPQDESESKRNMKHYFVLKPEYQGGNKVELYAPYDSYVAGFSDLEKGLEGELWFDAGSSEWEFSIEHINILQELKDGKNVKAGELIGYSGSKGFDIVYAVGAKETKEIDGWTSPFANLDTVFLHMSDEVQQEYRNYGLSIPNDFIYTREFRDQNPCVYMPGQAAQLNDIDHPEDWIFLNNPLSQ